MITGKEILDKDLKDGREYMHIGGERYRVGDCLLNHIGQEITIKEILDQTHFMDGRGFCLHSFMFYDQKWQHCFERNADKKTKDKTPLAKLMDRVDEECVAFKNELIKQSPTQVYDNYNRIYFYESVKRLTKGSSTLSEELCKEILKKGENPTLLKQSHGLLSDMYFHHISQSSAKTRINITNTVNSYISQGNQQH
ncbi:MAG: hypothetical protein FWC80_00390 [Firmicutes bacterium]|nr:hypothetical protein [Bacillota bacterium]